MCVCISITKPIKLVRLQETMVNKSIPWMWPIHKHIEIQIWFLLSLPTHMQNYTIYGLLLIGHAFCHIIIWIWLPPTTLQTLKIALNHVNNDVQNFGKTWKNIPIDDCLKHKKKSKDKLIPWVGGGTV
jgi:hypothetical protein